ncbi:SH3 domain-containing protein [Pseudonocardia sp. GCM10023141]|uniref:SH3 domain-containing protein n=1 Tax=Pseudonocardia sp. GCM10023141 TaxID=3252653 RepID=UPI00360A1F84
MNTRLTIRRPGRAVAVVGAVVAVSATTMMALIAGTATAAPTAPAEPGRCTQSVNVRSEPDIASRIVAVCEAGKQVKVGETRNGFVKLTDLSGWAAQEYVSVNGAAPAPAPADRPTVPPAPSAGDRVVPSQSAADGNRAGQQQHYPRSTSTPAPTATPTPDPEPAAAPSPLGGLLGG